MATSPTSQSAQLSGAAKDDAVGLNGDYTFTINDLLANDPGAAAKVNVGSQFFFGDSADDQANQTQYLIDHGITNNNDGTYTLTSDATDFQYFVQIGNKGTWSVADVDVTAAPPEPVFSFDGLSQFPWKSLSPLDPAGNWDNTSYHTTDNYGQTFGLGQLSGVSSGINGSTTLLQVFDASGAQATLAKQAVPALLNADSSGEDTLTAPYRFSVDEIKAAVQECYDFDPFGTGDNSLQRLDLANLLEFWNVAPAFNNTDGAHVPGELHSNDTTDIAETLHFNNGSNDLYGGSFEGDIFQVLNTLHPDHGWLV